VLLPLARRNDLITRRIPGELLVYDLKRHKAFCLNETAATIWESCNGSRTIADLIEEYQQQNKSAIDRRCVWLALDQLDTANLLQQHGHHAVRRERITRRGLVRAGVIAATLPIVAMIVAPTPQAAATSILARDCQRLKPSSPCGGLRCSDATGFCVAISVNKCGCA
jgi:hypothetical protein